MRLLYAMVGFFIGAWFVSGALMFALYQKECLNFDGYHQLCLEKRE